MIRFPEAIITLVVTLASLSTALPVGSNNFNEAQRRQIPKTLDLLGSFGKGPQQEQPHLSNEHHHVEQSQAIPHFFHPTLSPSNTRNPSHTLTNYDVFKGKAIAPDPGSHRTWMPPPTGWTFHPGSTSARNANMPKTSRKRKHSSENRETIDAKQLPPSIAAHLHYTDANGSNRQITYANVRAAVGMVKLRLREIKYRNGNGELSFPSTESIEVIRNSDQLPFLGGRRAGLPTNYEYSQMKPEDQQKWVTAIKITQSSLIQEARKHPLEGKTWPADLIRGKAEEMIDGRAFDNLTPTQKELYIKHHKRYDPTKKLGEQNDPERINYMASHRNLRANGIAFPAPAIGYSLLDIDSYDMSREVKAKGKSKEWAAKRQRLNSDQA